MNPQTPSFNPLSVQDLVINWHLTEACNYRCSYCYASWTRPAETRAVWRDPQRSFHILKELEAFFSSGNSNNPLSSMMRWEGLRLSLAGGEPLLLGPRFRQVAQQAQHLGFKLSLITNGSLLDMETLRWLCPKLELLGISVDAANAERSRLIGRQDRHGHTLTDDHLVKLISFARQANPRLKIKLNTVVNRHNWDQSLLTLIERCQPDRWKVLRVLPSVSHDHVITDDQFANFLDQHVALRGVMSVEDNSIMQGSYIMIDPHGRFFQNTPQGSIDGGYRYSGRIDEVGIATAFSQIEFSALRFASRYQDQERGVAA